MYLLAHKSVLTALITAVLAIGGCLPCQQLFASEPSSKSCCNSKGECQRPSPDGPNKKACNLQSAQVQSQPQQHIDSLVDDSLAYGDERIVESSAQSSSFNEISATCDIDASPPSLFLLNLCLLI